MVENVVLSITLCLLYAGLRKISYQICGSAETSPGWLVVSFYLVGTVSSTIWYFCLWFGCWEAQRQIRGPLIAKSLPLTELYHPASNFCFVLIAFSIQFSSIGFRVYLPLHY